MHIILATYNQARKQGMLMRHIRSCRYLQSCINQAQSANTHPSIGQEGKPTIHTRHLASENSDKMLYCVVRKNPIPIPIKILETATMTQLTDRNPTRLKTMIRTSEEKKGGLRPTRSASCPARRFPASNPATCMVMIKLGM